MKSSLKKAVLPLFLLLSFACVSTTYSQEATPGTGRAPQAPPRGDRRPPQPAPATPPPASSQTPTGSVSIEYSKFYEQAHDKCTGLGRKLGTDKGMPDIDQADNYMDRCMEALFVCEKNTSKCTITVASDGTKTAVCEKPLAGTCDNEAAELIEALITEMGPVKRYNPIDISKAGCGNMITEIDETCDEGNPAGSATCPAGCGVTPPVVMNLPAPADPVVNAQDNTVPATNSGVNIPGIPTANAGTVSDSHGKLSLNGGSAIAGCQLATAAVPSGSFGLMGILMANGGALVAFRSFRRRK